MPGGRAGPEVRGRGEAVTEGGREGSRAATGRLDIDQDPPPLREEGSIGRSRDPVGEVQARAPRGGQARRGLELFVEPGGGVVAGLDLCQDRLVLQAPDLVETEAAGAPEGEAGPVEVADVVAVVHPPLGVDVGVVHPERDGRLRLSHGASTPGRPGLAIVPGLGEETEGGLRR